MNRIIWGNTIVKNEDSYIWFAVKSVIDYLEKMLIWDTGSTDNTVEIIKLLKKEYPKKIEFKEVGKVDAEGLTILRQKMLNETKSGWLLLVDGDEVWYKSSIEKIINSINKEGGNFYAIVMPIVNIIGDIYHYQEDIAGQYQLLGKIGHFNIRAINRKIPGLHIKNTYPLEGFYHKDEKLIQDYGGDKLKFIDEPLLHFTHVVRSSEKTGNQQTASKRKMKYEIGTPFPKKFKYPEVLYFEKPSLVPSPWREMSGRYKLRAMVETPLKKLKRRIF